MRLKFLFPEVSLLSARGAAVRAVKKAEQDDWLVVRLQETAGRPAAVELAALAPIRAVRELRADEVEIERGEDIVLRDGVLTCDLGPYRPRTLALRLDPCARLEPPRSEPLDLPWNLDGLSPCADPTDGDWNGAGQSLPSERVPAEFVRDGVRFVTGPRGPGAANLLRCAGQTIELPASDLPRLQLLACSRGAARQAAFFVDGRAVMAELPSGSDWFGQWDSRLGGEDPVHEADRLTPAFLTDGEPGWIVTHLHEADGRTRSYAYTTFYRLEFERGDSRGPGRTLTLPDDPELVILAASLTDAGGALRHDPAGAFLDPPMQPSVRLDPPGGPFVDSLAVRVAGHSSDAFVEMARDDDMPLIWKGEPLVLTESAVVTITATGPEPGRTVRKGVYERVEPWPALEADGGEPGLSARAYLGAWERLPDWSSLPVHAESVEPTVAIPTGLPDEDVGVVFAGRIDVPRRGLYRFWLSSDDGSRLRIDGREVVDNDGLHGSAPVRGDVPLEAGLHALDVEFFQHLGGIDLRLEWSGPGFGREEVPAEALRR